MAEATDSPLIDFDEGPQTFGDKAREFVRTWGPAILAVLFIRTFIFEPFRIPSGSMVPTLAIGDHVFVTKSSYGVWVPATGVEIPFLDLLWVPPRFELYDNGQPDRGDIVVFRYPRAPHVNYIKRIVAIPGDRIRVQNNQIELNGVMQPSKYSGFYDYADDGCTNVSTKHYNENLDGVVHDVLTRRGMSPRLANHAEVTVPPNKVFVMGDNRDNSEDSRVWGFVDFNQIKGKAHFVWMSWDSCSGSAGGIGSMRSDRFFHPLYESTPSKGD